MVVIIIIIIILQQGLSKISIVPMGLDCLMASNVNMFPRSLHVDSVSNYSTLCTAKELESIPFATFSEYC